MTSVALLRATGFVVAVLGRVYNWASALQAILRARLHNLDRLMRKSRSNAFRILAGTLALTVPGVLWAYNFVPTDVEFYAWPKYCQISYVQSTIGSKSKWAAKVTRRDLDEANLVLGGRLRGGISLHHFCAGTAWLNRAKVEREEVRRKFMLSSALGETQYTLERTPKDHQLFPIIATHLATVLVEEGKMQEAIDHLDWTISVVPNSPSPYIEKAAIYYRDGQFGEALEVLKIAENAVQGASVDIQYSLGLTYLKLGEYEQAVEYAVKAEKAGYPLAGLKRQLQKKGYWDTLEQ